MNLTVVPYNSFTDLISVLPESTRNACETNNDRFLYLNDYLKQIGCKTIIIETKYVDKNFLDDYSEYYSRCFQDIQKSAQGFIFSLLNLVCQI